MPFHVVYFILTNNNNTISYDDNYSFLKKNLFHKVFKSGCDFDGSI